MWQDKAPDTLDLSTDTVGLMYVHVQRGLSSASVAVLAFSTTVLVQAEQSGRPSRQTQIITRKYIKHVLCCCKERARARSNPPFPQTASERGKRTANILDTNSMATLAACLLHRATSIPSRAETTSPLFLVSWVTNWVAWLTANNHQSTPAKHLDSAHSPIGSVIATPVVRPAPA